MYMRIYIYLYTICIYIYVYTTYIYIRKSTHHDAEIEKERVCSCLQYVLGRMFSYMCITICIDICRESQRERLCFYVS